MLISVDFISVILLEETQCWGKYPHRSQADCVVVSQILQNLMNLPSYCSELTELYAV